jgi:hypothetical protein
MDAVLWKMSKLDKNYASASRVDGILAESNKLSEKTANDKKRRGIESRYS